MWAITQVSPSALQGGLYYGYQNLQNLSARWRGGFVRVLCSTAQREEGSVIGVFTGCVRFPLSARCSYQGYKNLKRQGVTSLLPTTLEKNVSKPLIEL